MDKKPGATPENAAVQLKEAAARGNVLLLLNRHGMCRFVGLSVENIGPEGSTAERAIEELGWGCCCVSRWGIFLLGAEIARTVASRMIVAAAGHIDQLKNRASPKAHRRRR